MSNAGSRGGGRGRICKSEMNRKIHRPTKMIILLQDQGWGKRSHERALLFQALEKDKMATISSAIQM